MKGRTLVVTRVLDYWVREGRWWAAPEKRVYFRIEKRDTALEVYRSGTEWILSRVFD